MYRLLTWFHDLIDKVFSFQIMYVNLAPALTAPVITKISPLYHIFFRDGILSVADYNSTRVGVVIVVVVFVIVVAEFTMG